MENDLAPAVPLLEVTSLTRHFGGLVAVNRLDLVVERGQIVGLIGPNGAGKTTIFDLLTGFLVPDAGSICFEGKHVTGLSPHRICLRGMTRTFQGLKPFPRLNVLGNVMVGALARTSNKEDAHRYAMEALELLGLAPMARRAPGELSVGHLKMLELAKALATQPRLLLLDEPYAGLNPSEGAHLGQLLLRIRDRGVTVLLIEHVMKAVMAVCQRVVVLHHGLKIAEGTPAEIASDPTVVRAYLGGTHA